MLKKMVFLASMLLVVSCASTTQVASNDNVDQDKVAKKEVKQKKVGRGCEKKRTGSRLKRC